MVENKTIFPLAMVLLLPLLPSLIQVVYELYLLPSMAPVSVAFQMLIRILIFGLPISLIIYYGYSTGNKIVSTLAGALLIPLELIYSQVLFEILDPDFMISGAGYWLGRGFISDSLPAMLVYGLMGYSASKGTREYLILSILLAVLILIVVSTID